MNFTHKYDYLAKIPTVLLVIAFAVYFQIHFPGRQKNFGFVLAAIPAVLIYLILLRPLSAWCYSRFTLKAQISFAQARRAASIFSPLSRSASWQPLDHVSELPSDARVQAVMSAVDAALEPSAIRAANWAKAPWYAWLLRLSLWGLFVFLGLGLFLDWWPFLDLAHWQATYLFSGKFYRSLNALIAIFPVAVPYALLEQHFGGPLIHEGGASDKREGEQTRRPMN